MKPCEFCHKPAPATFDAKRVFNIWADQNEIISPDRSRFDGVRECLNWAALDESETGAHPDCALRWAVTREGFFSRYPLCELPDDLKGVTA